VEPLRAAPPLGSPAVPASALAAIWIVVGVVLSPGGAKIQVVDLERR